MNNERVSVDPSIVATWAVREALRFQLAILPTMSAPIEVRCGDCWRRAWSGLEPVNAPMLHIDVDLGLCDLAPFDAVRRVHALVLEALRARGYWWAGMVPLINVAQPRGPVRA